MSSKVHIAGRLNGVDARGPDSHRPPFGVSEESRLADAGGKAGGAGFGEGRVP